MVKNPPANARGIKDVGLIPGLERSGEGNGHSLQYSCLESPMDRRAWFDSWVRKIHWRRDRLPTSVLLGFPCSSVGKESACNVGDLGLIPALGRSLGEEKGYPLQYSGLEKSMDLQRVGHNCTTFTIHTNAMVYL